MSNLAEQTSTNNREFKVGDKVVNPTFYAILEIRIITEHQFTLGFYHPNGRFETFRLTKNKVRHATPEEIAAGRRLDISDWENTTATISNLETVGDDAHIENHISPHCRINCFQDDTEIGTRTVDIEAENERLKTENLAMQAEIDLLKEALDIKESLNNALRARDEARQSMLINGGEV